MGTRGIFQFGKKRFYVSMDAYPDYALSRLQRIVKANPKNPVQYGNKIGYKHWLSPMGAKEQVGYPFEEFRYVANPRTKQVKYLDVFAHVKKRHPLIYSGMAHSGEVEAKKVDRSVESWASRQFAKKRHPTHVYQTGKSDYYSDVRRKAYHPGRRVAKSGRVYYEYRRNRSDADRRKRY
jgi:hypothetical protein